MMCQKTEPVIILYENVRPRAAAANSPGQAGRSTRVHSRYFWVGEKYNLMLLRIQLSNKETTVPTVASLLVHESIWLFSRPLKNNTNRL
jgi:hypothetical protein